MTHDPIPDPTPQAPAAGVVIAGQAQVHVGGDFIGGDQYIGVTAEQMGVLLTRLGTEFQPKPFDGNCPYVGLAAFQEEDADRFFGRERETAELVTRVQASSSTPQARAVFIAGPSGSGKSSLVRAGLIPALKKNAILGSDRWRYETLKPGRSPLEALGRAVGALADSRTASEELKTLGLTDPKLLHQWVEIALKDDPNRRAVIYVDQFEEIFTQVTKENERAAFLKLLTYAATVPDGRTLLLFTLRSDFVTNCASYPELNALLNQQFFQVGAMTSDDLASAVARPALQVGLRLDPALVAQVVNDVRGEPGALPLMQFALEDLCNAEKAKGELTLDGYMARGGLRKALERHADAEFQKLDESEKQLARNVFSGLVEVGRGAADTKRTAQMQELVPAGVDPARVQALVTELADARLISTDERDGKLTVTLAHERLLDAWEWLRRLVNENRDAIALQNEIAQDAQDWATSGRNQDYLYRGARLATAQEKLQDKQLVLSGVANEFVQAGIATREAERAEREAQRQRELEQAQQLAAEQKQRAEEQAAANQRLRQRNVFLIAAFVIALLLAGAALFLFNESNTNLQAAFNAEGTAVANADAAEAAQEQAEQQAIAAATARAEAEQQAIAANEARGLAQSEADVRATAEANAVSESERAEQQAREARRQLSKVLALQGQSVFDLNPQRGLLLGLEALKVTLDQDGYRVPSVETALRQELGNAGGRVLARSQEPSEAVALSADLKWLATLERNGTAHLHALNPTAPAVELEGDFDAISMSPDGHWLVADLSYSFDLGGGSKLWDLNEPARPPIVLSDEEGFESISAISPNSRWLVTASGSDNSARLWDLTSLDPASQTIALEGGRGPVAFSPDSRWLVTGGDSSMLRLWDLASPESVTLESGSSAPSYILNFPTPDTPQALQQILQQVEENEIPAVSFSPDSSSLVAARGACHTRAPGDHTTVAQWDLNDPAAAPDVRQGVGGPVAAIVHDNASGWLFVRFGTARGVNCGAPNSVRLFNLREIDPLASPVDLQALPDSVTLFAPSPDRRWLLTSSSDNTARIWDLTQNPLPTPRVLRGHEGLVRAAAISFDDRWLVTSSDDNTIRLWGLNAADLNASPIVLPNYIGAAEEIDISPDSFTLVTNGADEASGTSDGTTVLWDLESSPIASMVLPEQDPPISRVTFSPDRHWALTANRYYAPRLWKMSAIGVLSDPIPIQEPAYEVVFSPDSHWLVTGGYSEDVQLWDLSTGASPPAHHDLRTGAGEIERVAISPDSHWLVTAGNASNIPELWDLTKNASSPPQDLLTHPVSVRQLAISPDGQWLAMTSFDNALYLWNLAAPEPAATVREMKIEGINVVISADSHWLVTGDSNGNTNLWDLTSSNPLANPIELAAGGVPVAISPDNHWLVTYTENENKLWELPSVEHAASTAQVNSRSLLGHARDFSPDSRWLLTVDYSNDTRLSTPYLWDLTDPDPTASPIPLSAHEGQYGSYGFSSEATDTRWLLTGELNGKVVNLWHLRLADLIDIACSIAARNLSREEWAQYINADESSYDATCPDLSLDAATAPP